MAIDAFKDLDDFSKDLLDLASELEDGKHIKRFLKSEGNKLRKKTIKEAEDKIEKQKTGNYIARIKRGRAYKFRETDAFSLRVYSTAPHAHLIEYGHIKVAPYTHEEQGFIPGKYIFDSASNSYEKKFYTNTEKFIDKCLKDHGL